MQTTEFANDIDTGPQKEMICISEDDAGVKFVLEPFKTNALDRGLCTDGHKNRRLYQRAPGSEYPCPSFSVARGHCPGNGFTRHKN